MKIIIKETRLNTNMIKTVNLNDSDIICLVKKLSKFHGEFQSVRKDNKLIINFSKQSCKIEVL